MVNELINHRIGALLACLVTWLCLIQCDRTDCYQLQFAPNPGMNLSKDSPVILENRIIGYVEEIRGSNENSVARFCIPETTQIPRNSKIYVGFIQAFSVNGIKIEPSNELEFLIKEELLTGLSMDSIEIAFPASDTSMVNKLIETMKDVNEGIRGKRDSTGQK